MENKIKYTLRCSRELMDEIQAIAAKEHRSASAQIIVILEDYLKSHQNVSEEQQPPKN